MQFLPIFGGNLDAFDFAHAPKICMRHDVWESSVTCRTLASTSYWRSNDNLFRLVIAPAGIIERSRNPTRRSFMDLELVDMIHECSFVPECWPEVRAPFLGFVRACPAI